MSPDINLSPMHAMPAKKATSKKKGPATAKKKLVTAKKKPPTTKKPAGTKEVVNKPLPKNWRVRIRMHRQGVGDCFLVTFRTGDTVVNMLFDCGLLPSSPKEFSRLEEVTTVLRDELKATNGKLDVVVITHEHADHVSGFEPGKKTALILDEIPIEHVWMAWTEASDDKLAQRLNGTLAMHAMAAALTLPGMKRAGALTGGSRFAARAARSAENAGDILENWGLEGEAPTTIPRVFGAFGAAPGGPFAAKFARTVRDAVEHVKGRVPLSRFHTYRPGEPPHSLPGIPKEEVRVFVLGPPRLEDLGKAPRHGPTDDIFHIATDKLPAMARSLAAAALPPGSAEDELTRPFSDDWYCKGRPTSSAHKGQRAVYGKAKWRNIDDDWLMSGGTFAMQLDSATNNTSLVLAIELVKTGEVLLFPGDAQIENWETWRNLKWKVSDASGTEIEITGESLLQRTVFYKTSHHGSHNGSLNKHGVALMPSKGLVAMVPVVHAVTNQRKGDWKEIPKPSLCTALEKKCGEGFIRMDAPKGTLAGRLGGRVQEHDLYVDYYIE